MLFVDYPPRNYRAGFIDHFKGEYAGTAAALQRVFLHRRQLAVAAGGYYQDKKSRTGDVHADDAIIVFEGDAADAAGSPLGDPQIGCREVDGLAAPGDQEDVILRFSQHGADELVARRQVHGQ